MKLLKTLPRDPRTILIDLDGTLTDPIEGIGSSMRYALERLGRPAPSEAELRAVIGPPIQIGMARLLGAPIGNEAQADAREVEQGIAFYRERYRERGMVEAVLYPGVMDSLTRLKAQGRRLIVATSKPHAFAVPVLEHFKVAPFFDAIYGSELDGTRGNKAELIGYLLGREPVDPGSAVMIGDREHDVNGAAPYGIPTIGVLYGYGSREELAHAGAAALCSSASEWGSAWI